MSAGLNPSPLPDVTVLLSVFDGDRFIQEQRDSIAAQQDVRWSLIWRDDGSQPARSCRSALHALAEHHEGRVRELADSGQPLGVGRSYMALLAAADDAPFVAFADQDDVWLPHKLRRAIDRLPGGDGPALYCGRQRLVDAALRPLGCSPLPNRPLGFANALVQNLATGCTIVMNQAARRAVLAMPMPDTIHDWWCYLVVAGVGGTLVYDPEPCILYRQHDANAVGSARDQATRAWRALGRGPAPFLDRLDAHLRVLADHRACLTPENQVVLDALRAARTMPAWRRLPALLRTGIYRQGTAEDLLLRLWLMFGRA